ncbi:MAG TPA: hypothetical protein VFV11_09015 [Solimonas sp.]|nr:hypothetical protein [Solimonas sp.]
MNTNYLPAIASHARFSEWIETQETLLGSHLLVHPRSGALSALFLSQDGNGEYLVRLCEGADDACMRWSDQRRARSRFGRGYAEALAGAWLTRLESAGWRLEWSARREAAAPAAMPEAEPADYALAA